MHHLKNQTCIFLLAFILKVSAAAILYDGRASWDLSGNDLDNSVGPYLTAVKGQTQSASHYTTLLGHSMHPTPLWEDRKEQAISISIDNTSVFVPGAGTGAPQYGFRRTELIAQPTDRTINRTTFNEAMETNTTIFHFSIRSDEKRRLNYNHEYQIVFVEPADGSHVFGVQLGSPFTTDPKASLPSLKAHSFKILDHALNALFATPFTPSHWHNFAIKVDWENLTLRVFYSKDGASLFPVSGVHANEGVAAGSAGQGDFHFGVLKLPLVNPLDSSEDQADVVHHGTQEGTIEGLIYSGVFVQTLQRSN